MENTVDILVVTYNRIKYLKSFIAMLHLSTNHPFRLFVVDNGSTDGSREFILDMETAGFVYGHLFTEQNLPLASAFSACFNKFYDELNELVMTAADDHTPPMSLKVDWLDIFVKKMLSNEKIGTINFRGSRLFYQSFCSRYLPKIKEKIKDSNDIRRLKYDKIKEHIYGEW